MFSESTEITNNLSVINDFDLSQANTFGMHVKCKQWMAYRNVDGLIDALKSIGNNPFIHIGAGSNLLFTGNFDGIVLHSEIKTMQVVAETNTDITIKVGSGVVFDELIAHTCSLGFWGIENLSGIPGEVGASAVQNIGAYGVEAKDVIVQVECIEVGTLKTVVFDNADCKYDYRDSLFKHDKNHYIVTAVTFRLSKIAAPKLSYGNLADSLNADTATPTDVRNTVLTVRDKKLPRTDQYGSAGSFFKNPVVDASTFNRLRALPGGENMPHYTVGDAYKIPAAWLIEQCGWKGKSLGNAAVWHLQPLVIVNNGNASAAEIIALESAIIKSVNEKFGLTLHPEVEHV